MFNGKLPKKERHATKTNKDSSCIKQSPSLNQEARIKRVILYYISEKILEKKGELRRQIINSQGVFGRKKNVIHEIIF